MAPIGELLRATQTVSFEFFPPKDAEEQVQLVKALRELETLAPSFVSVTYRGGRESRQRTHDLVAGILRTTTLTPMAHLTCSGHTRLELAEILVGFRRAGIENLMALGGDPLPGEDGTSELSHAIELVELARAVGGFSIGVAAHPAGHPRSPSMAADRGYLAEKLRLADFAVTQFFFRPEQYFGLLDELAGLGVDRPVLPGVIPVTSLSSVPRMAIMGSAVPPELVERLRAAGEAPGAVRAAGVDAATELCRQLLDGGAPGLHFYTLNRSSATREIHRNLAFSAAPSTP